MRRIPRLSWLAALLTLAVLLTLGVSAFADNTEPLFFIQRSKNANEIHYDARVTSNGALDAKDPIDAYWLRKATDNSRGPIGVFQKMAYGYDVDKNADGTYKMKLTAFKKRPLTLVRVNGKWRAQVMIAGKDAYLNHLYIATDESGVIPKVLYVDVFGEETSGGKPVTERLVNN